MNCCDEYGQCQQGQGCPAREAFTKPEENQPWAWIDRLGFWWACGLTGAAIGFGLGLGHFFNFF